MTYKNCKLGAVERHDVGPGFVVRGEHNMVLFSLAYETEAKAKAAHDMMARVLEGAAVTPAPQ